MEAFLISAQLPWTRHVIRMRENRLLKQAFYSQLEHATRSLGGSGRDTSWTCWSTMWRRAVSIRRTRDISRAQVIVACAVQSFGATLQVRTGCAGPFGPCRLQLQPLNISWTTVTEPALAASPAADQLQTRQTLLAGYFFPTTRLPRSPRWFYQPIQSVSLAAIINTEASVSSAAQLGHCCSSFLCCCSETLELSSTELSNCSIR